MPDKQGTTDDVPFEDAMEIAGYGKFSLFIIILSGLTMSSAILGSLDVSFLLPAAECDLELSSKDKGLLGSAFFIGSMSSSHLSGYLTDTLGRQYVLLRGLSLNVLFYILGAFAPNFWSFFILKIISGVMMCPAMIATIPLLGEFVPSKRRAQALLMCMSFSTIGLLYSALLGWVILQSTWRIDLWMITFTPWRLFFLLCGVPSLISSLLLYVSPESPKFMLSRGMRHESLKILQRVHSVNSGKILDSYPVNSVKMDADEAIAPPVAEGKGIMPVLKHVCDQTLPLFKPPYLKNLMLCIILMVDVFLCFNTILMWLPEVINRMDMYKMTHEGHFSMCEMVERAPHPKPNITYDETVGSPGECVSTINTAVFLPNSLISLVQPVVMLAASVIIPLFDRRIVLLVILILCGSIAFVVTMVHNMYVIMLLLGGMPILSGLCYNVLSSILIDLFPTYIRAMAVSINIVSGRLGAIIGSQVFSLLIDTQCTLFFHVISGTLLCCAVVPLFVKKTVDSNTQNDATKKEMGSIKT